MAPAIALEMESAISTGDDASVAKRVSGLQPPHASPTPRRRSVSGYELRRNELSPEDLLSLTRTASNISSHRQEHLARSQATQMDSMMVVAVASGGQPVILPSISPPQPAKPGPIDTIRELPSDVAQALNRERGLEGASATTTRQTIPALPFNDLHQPGHAFDVEDHTVGGYPDVGVIASWRGCAILLITCGAQMIDNVFMTAVNISLPAVQREFGVDSSSLQWLISAYTLTFGGFLLLAGVLSDRYGRKHIFCAGMAWLSIWTIANGFATSFIQLAIFRALQGIGAAMTVPSGVGIISSFFVAQDRTKALTYFGSAGALGFCLGFVMGGFLTGSLGWRYTFYLTAVMSSVLGILGWLILPEDRRDDHQVKPKLDILGSAMSTAGLILLSFVIASGGEYGWGKAFIIALLILSVALLIVFAYVETKVSNPIMPLSLWKLPNFAIIWSAGFVAYGGYQTWLYYATLISQEVIHLSASGTALRFLPMGGIGALCTAGLGQVLDRFNPKHLLLFGLLCCAVAPIPCAVMDLNDISYWKHVLPTSVVGVMGIGTTYCTVTVVALASVPLGAKSLCGGMINTSFQIGSGVGLALASAVVQSVDINKDHGLLAQYKTGMWCCVGLAGLGFLSSLGVKNVGRSHVPTGAH